MSIAPMASRVPKNAETPAHNANWFFLAMIPLSLADDRDGRIFLFSGLILGTDVLGHSSLGDEPREAFQLNHVAEAVVHPELVVAGWRRLSVDRPNVIVV